MNRVIILEGPDGSGKTTLATTLARDHGFKVIHTGKPEPEWTSHDLFREYVMKLWRALLDDQPVVFDRLYLGELVYGSVMRGRCLLSEVQHRLLERLTMAKDVKTLICLPPWPVVLDNWEAKAEDYIVIPDKLFQVYQGYRGFRATGKYYDYDYTSFNAPAGYSRAFAPGPTLPRDVVGSPQAKLLIVGEQVNTNVTSTDWAFFSDRGSSGFLNQAIIDSKIPETDLAFVNAMRLDGSERVMQPILDRLPNLKTCVALGRRAETILKRQGVPFQHLPHPAFVKRFQAGVNDYAADLKKIYEEVTCQPV